MLLDQTAALRQCIRLHQDTLAALAPYADAVQYALDHDDLSALIAIYHAVYPLLEQEIWNGQAFHSTLDLYQSLFREQEALIQHAGNEQRYDFILSIPGSRSPAACKTLPGKHLSAMCELWLWRAQQREIQPGPGHYC